MAKARKVIVNSKNQEVEEGDPDSAVILSLDVAEQRGVKLLRRKRAEERDEAPEAKQVEGPPDNKALKAPAEAKGR